MTRVVVILAAGRGTRLATASAGRPKVLVEVGGRTLLARSLTLQTDEAIVVTGHDRETVEAFVAAGRWPHPVRTVFNERFAVEGNARSLAVALGAIAPGADVLKLDGDLLVAPEAIAKLWSAGTSAALVDFRGPLDDEAMKAKVVDGRVVGLGKGLVGAHGESIGAEILAAEDLVQVADALERTLTETPSAYYEDAYQRLLPRWTLQAVAVSTPWAEIDTPDDLQAAEAMLMRSTERS